MKDDEFSYHELIDRMHLINCMFEDFILGHLMFEGRDCGWTEEQREFYKEATEASFKLGALYQKIALISDRKFHPEDTL